MRYAFDENDKKIEVSKSGEQGKCPDCNSVVIGKKGKIKIKHWSHKANKDCDNWYEPITKWHLNWQNKFPLDNQEVTLIDTKNIRHRADIVLNNKLVIEIQYSPIKIDEIEQRETFYGKEGMIWILNGKNLASNSELHYQTNKKLNSICISIPEYFTDIHKYDMDNFRTNLLNKPLFKEIFDNKNFKSLDISNGSHFEIEFHENFNSQLITYEIQNQINELCRELYSWEAKRFFGHEFKTELHRHSGKFTNINLHKRYWRQFIDRMKYPVFFDKLNGLENDHLYWYQENKIVEKKRFLSKYSKYV